MEEKVVLQAIVPIMGILMLSQMMGGVEPTPPDIPIPPTPPPGKANLYGRVQDVLTGGPIAGVQCVLDGVTTETNEYGDYTFIDQGPATYSVQFSKEGYEMMAADVVLHEGNNRLDVLMTPVALPIAGSIGPGLIYYEEIGQWKIAKAGMEVPVNSEIHLAPGWMNESEVSIVGHVDLLVIYPDGSEHTLSATLNQDKETAPGHGWHVEFEPFSSSQEGVYTVTATLSSGGQVLGSVTFTLVAVTAIALAVIMGPGFIWYEDLADWELMRTLSREIALSKEIHLAPLWGNRSEVNITGHMDLLVVYPDGSEHILSAVLNQDEEAAPGNGYYVQFEPFISSQEGTYTCVATLSSAGQVLGSVTFTLKALATANFYWLRPTGHIPSRWNDEELAYDGWTDTRAEVVSVSPRSWSPYLELTIPPTEVSAVRWWGSSPVSPRTVQVIAYYGGYWHDIYDGSAVVMWEDGLAIPDGTQVISKVGIRFYNPAYTISMKFRVNEIQLFGYAEEPPPGPEPLPTTRLYGYVTNRYTGAPIVGAIGTVYQDHDTETEDYDFTTDSSGYYLIDNMLHEYNLTQMVIYADGYKTYTNENVSISEGDNVLNIRMTRSAQAAALNIDSVMQVFTVVVVMTMMVGVLAKATK